jgi:hypothetical protein
MLVSDLLIPNCRLIDLCKSKSPRRIDLHHHFFPPSLDKARKNIEVGWRTPVGNMPWEPKVSLTAMDALGIEIAILSLPANSSGVIATENRNAARAHNQFAAQICREHPGRFGFFAGLPFLDDVAGRWFLLILQKYIQKKLTDKITLSVSQVYWRK